MCKQHETNLRANVHENMEASWGNTEAFNFKDQGDNPQYQLIRKETVKRIGNWGVKHAWGDGRPKYNWILLEKLVEQLQDARVWMNKHALKKNMARWLGDTGMFTVSGDKVEVDKVQRDLWRFHRVNGTF